MAPAVAAASEPCAATGYRAAAADFRGWTDSFHGSDVSWDTPQKACQQAAAVTEAPCEGDVVIDSGAARVVLNATQALRARSAIVRDAVVQAGERLRSRGERLLLLLCEADHGMRGVGGLGGLAAAAAAAEDHAAEIRALEQQVEELKLVEGDQRRVAEVEFSRSEKELELLAQHAAEAERSEAEAQLEAAALPPELRAALAAEERELEAAQRRDVARDRERQVAAAPLPEELMYFEWCNMLSEDRPEHAALCVAEAARDGWEQQLRGIVGPAAFGSAARVGASPDLSSAPPGGALASACGPATGSSSQGLGRLDAELHGLGVRDRARRATSGQCLQRLSDEGPWRLAFSEAYEAFQLVEELREHNNALAGELVSLRWRRLGHGGGASPAACLVEGPGPPASAPVFASTPSAPTGGACASAASAMRRPTSAPLARGPRFNAPPIFPGGVGQSPGAAGFGCTTSGRGAGHDSWPEAPSGQVMPRPVVADAREWEAGNREHHQRRDENGLAALLGARRFKPGSAMFTGFEASAADWGGAPPVVEQPDPPRAKRPPGAAELAKATAAKFAEPLCYSFGGARRGSDRGSGVRPRAASVSGLPKPRAEWVTFESAAMSAGSSSVAGAAVGRPAAPAALATAPGRLDGSGCSANGFAALDTIPGAFDGAAIPPMKASQALPQGTIPSSWSNRPAWADDLEFRVGTALSKGSP